jgi:hypothetical protein
MVPVLLVTTKMCFKKHDLPILCLNYIPRITFYTNKCRKLSREVNGYQLLVNVVVGLEK